MRYLRTRTYLKMYTIPGEISLLLLLRNENDFDTLNKKKLNLVVLLI